MRQFLVLFLFVLATVLAQAAGRSGPEWTFTNEELIELGRNQDGRSLFDSSNSNAGELHDRYQQRMLSLWVNEIKLACPRCEIKEFGAPPVTNQFHVQISKDVWFKVTRDPWVLEVIASPMNKRTFSEHAGIFQKLIWDSANKIGMSPHSRVGGGHIHLEIKSFFGEDRNLFRNFLVDLTNHPELFLGALGFDLLNAPPIAIQYLGLKNSFEGVISQFDKGGISISGLMRLLNSQVYTETFYDRYPHQMMNPAKYQAINLLHDETIELRGINPQQSAHIHFLLIQLFEARIEYLKKQTGLVPFQKMDYSSQVNSHTVRGMEFHSSIIDPSLIEQKARSYIQESGLRWSDYSDLILKNISTVRSQGASCKTAVGL